MNLVATLDIYQEGCSSEEAIHVLVGRLGNDFFPLQNGIPITMPFGKDLYRISVRVFVEAADVREGIKTVYHELRWRKPTLFTRNGQANFALWVQEYKGEVPAGVPVIKSAKGTKTSQPGRASTSGAGHTALGVGPV